jgi:sec-independent protein translocase protein TatA
MFGLGAGELLVILIVALIFVGPKKLPELAKGLGKALREFQKAKDELMNEMNRPETKDETPKSIKAEEKAPPSANVEFNPSEAKSTDTANAVADDARPQENKPE